MTKSFSIVIPFFNEESNLEALHSALLAETGKIPHTFEFVFVNDGSTDQSADVVEKMRAADPRVKHIEFTRNFGKEIATTAGLDAAKGDAVIIMDADLQHPPALIPLFISKWKDGAEVVIGKRTRNKGDTLFTRFGSYAFHKIMSVISETHLVRGETDFRLVDRSVVEAFKHLRERNRMTRTLINWLGFRSIYIGFEAPERHSGVKQYSILKLLHLALHSFVANSLFPLRLAGYLGVFISSTSFILGIAVFFERYIYNDYLGWNISGPAQLAIIIVFLAGTTLMSLGLIALYIENIHTQVSGRPLYVIRKKK